MGEPIKNAALFTTQVKAGSRRYFFDVYKDSKGCPFLSISEIPFDTNTPRRFRQRLFVHVEHLDQFRDALNVVIERIKADAEL